MFLNMSTSVSINSTSAPQKQNSKLDSETINHLWLQIKNLVKLQFTSIAPHIRFKIFLFECIDQISHDCTQVDKLLITKEAYWSAQLLTLSPYGLNKRQDNSLDD